MRGGVLPSPQGPFPYKDDRIQALEHLVRRLYVLWLDEGLEVTDLLPEHQQLLREVIRGREAS